MSARIPTNAELHAILNRGVADIISKEVFTRLLKAGKPLRLKQGFDPTRPDLHLGHVVGLRKLRQLQELGHTVVLIVGDWTAQIGDPSGRSEMRTMLSAEEVAQNAETYLHQFFKIVDPNKTEVRRQTEWFNHFDLKDVIQLTRKFTVAQLLKRDDFAKRFAADQPIAITELLYPLLQAYDSVMVQADVEFGGTDQRFNNLLGRELQEISGQRPQQVFLVPILIGTDGTQKMSKSLGNYIAVNDSPNDMYGKVMSIPDKLIGSYYEMLTDVPDAELAGIVKQVESGAVNPMTLKKRLAALITEQFHGKAGAQQGAEHFERTVQHKERPADMPTIALPFGGATAEVNVAKLLHRAGLAPSAMEGRRLVQQGSVKLDGRKLEAHEQSVVVKPGAVIQVGSRRYVQVVSEAS